VVGKGNFKPILGVQPNHFERTRNDQSFEKNRNHHVATETGQLQTHLYSEVQPDFVSSAQNLRMKKYHHAYIRI
jgi:hypothetical protein